MRQLPQQERRMPICCAHRRCQKTSERPRPQAAADSDMDDAERRPSRERKAPERIEVDANITSRAIGQRWSASMWLGQQD